MNQQQARAALALGNLTLTLAVLGLGYWTFLVRHEPPKDSSVPNYDPRVVALPTQSRAQDPFAEYQVVWTQIDKPPPPPPPPPPPGPPQPTAEDLQARFRVTLVALATEGGSSYAIIEPKAGGDSVVITVNEQLAQPYQQYKCVGIEERREQKQCVVLLQDASGNTSPVILNVGKAE